MNPTPLQRQPKTLSIVDEYDISNTVLGLGINGKVVECTNRKTKQHYALKVGQYFLAVYRNKFTRSFFSTTRLGVIG